MKPINFSFDNTYVRNLVGFYVRAFPEKSPKPRLLFFNRALSNELGLGLDNWNHDTLAQLFSGNALPAGADPIAQIYAGHQFGQFVPQLGDGRALIWGEVINPHGQRYDLAFKGSGRTPFSRRGDGKAIIAPMLREALISEAMHALKIPSTRTLAVVKTGEGVYRQGIQPGAVLTRVASSHLRIGTFEFFSAKGDIAKLQQLAEYSISRHYPELLGEEKQFLLFIEEVLKQQAELIAQWMGVGFIHGVMNTDNMTISGETIDFGPCAFMEHYDPQTVFSSIDHHGRYAYGNQANIAYGNLWILAESLLPLLGSVTEKAVAEVSEIIKTFPILHHKFWQNLMEQKLGLSFLSDESLLSDWFNLLQKEEIDWTLAWSGLTEFAQGREEALFNLFTKKLALKAWLKRWQLARQQSSIDSVELMKPANPWVIPRNHLVEAAVSLAQNEDNLTPFNRLFEVLQKPYDMPEDKQFIQPADRNFTKGYQTFCGT